MRPKKLDRDNSQLPPTGTANGGMSLSTGPLHEHTGTQNHTITTVYDICLFHVAAVRESCRAKAISIQIPDSFNITT